MIKLKDLLVERIDYLDTAEYLVKQYKLKSKIKFSRGSSKADYDWMKDIIYLRTSYSSVKDFLITVLHEIDHAKDAYRMGKRKYEDEYQKAGDLAVHKGKDFHDDNAFEEKAEDWAKKEVNKWIKKV